MEDNKKQYKKVFIEAEINIVNIGKNDIICTSGCESDCPSNGCQPTNCLALGTKITLSNGFTKNIEDLIAGDCILAFDHELGKYVPSTILYLYKGEISKKAFTLNFSNGATLSIIGDHSLFEKESNKYVCILEETAEDFIGKHFFSYNDKTYVELVSVTYEDKETEYFEIYTSKTMNMIANGMLNVASDVDYILNIYEFNDDLKADMGMLSRDIQQYGLFEYNEELSFTKEEFEAWRANYILIACGKGLITIEQARAINKTYIDSRNDIKLEDANYTESKFDNIQTLD